MSAGKVLRTLKSEDTLDNRFILFDPAGGRLAALARHRRTLYVWEVKTGAVQQRPLPDSGTSLVFDQEGKRIAIGFEDGSIEIRDAGTLDELGHLVKCDAAVRHLAFHPGRQATGLELRKAR